MIIQTNFLRLLVIFTVFSSSVSAVANPGKRLMPGMIRGMVLGASNFLALQCVEVTHAKNTPDVAFARDLITSGMTGLAYFTLRSQVPPVVVMGVGFAGMSVLGNFLTLKNAACDSRKISVNHSEDLSTSDSECLANESQEWVVLGHEEGLENSERSEMPQYICPLSQN